MRHLGMLTILLATATTAAAAQAPPQPMPGPAPCRPMPECLVVNGPEPGDDRGGLLRSLRPQRPPSAAAEASVLRT